MNAGRDVERLIAGWLVEEARGRAPDRVLDAAASVVDRTKQRRFAAAWREPMYVTIRGLVAATVVAAVAIGGASFVLRPDQTGHVGPSNTPDPSFAASPSSTPDPSAELAAYRVARNAICDAFWVVRNAHDAAQNWERLYDPTLPATDRAAMADSLEAYATAFSDFTDQIADLAAPVAIASEAAVAVSRQRDTISIIKQDVELLRQGDLAGAEAVDIATGPLSAGIEAFERKYALEPCP